MPLPLAPDGPARARLQELKESGASREDVLAAMETFEVPVSYLVKALSPGHAKFIAGELMQHMVDTHTEPGTFAISFVGEPTKQDWIDGLNFDTELHG